MSNVNPNHYKVAGRERQGDGLLQERHRQKFAGSRVRDRFETRQVPPAPALTDTATPESSVEPSQEPATATGPKLRKSAAPARKAPTAARKAAPKTTKKAAAQGRQAVAKPGKKTAAKSAKSAGATRARSAGSAKPSSKASSSVERGRPRKRRS